jgi:hypothetical protein
MGNDIFWKGRQPDINKQKQCSLVLHTFFKETNFYHKTYNEKIEIPVVDLNKDNGKKIHECIEILGVTSWHIPSDDDRWHGIANSQFSFVFNNSPYLKDSEKGQLITYEQIDDIESERYDKLSNIVNIKHLKTNKIGAFSIHNNIRVSASKAFTFIKVLFLVKTLFVPDLDASDDYLEWKTIVERAEADGFNERIRKSKTLFEALEFSMRVLFQKDIDEKFFPAELVDYWK